MSLNIKKFMPVISFECNPTQGGLIRNNEIFDILKIMDTIISMLKKNTL